jgi:cell fate (sporulation/competence/biofilm development) regulator YlbF (YheA/YmcA/DUF963 family)
MINEKIIDLCYKINEDIKNSEEYINYKKYEKRCLENHSKLFDDFKSIQEEYFRYKSFLKEDKLEIYKNKYLNKKKELFEIEDIKLYFIYKKQVEELLGNINKQISEAINKNIKYINELGLLSGGKNCG